MIFISTDTLFVAAKNGRHRLAEVLSSIAPALRYPSGHAPITYGS